MLGKLTYYVEVGPAYVRHCMLLDRLFGAHCKRPARELQANWNPVLNLYENSEFVELGRLHPLQRSSQNFGTKQRALWHFSLHCMRRRIIDITACPRKDYGYFHCHFGTPESKIVCFWFGHDARLACGLLSCPTSVESYRLAQCTPRITMFHLA